MLTLSQIVTNFKINCCKTSAFFGSGRVKNDPVHHVCGLVFLKLICLCVNVHCGLNVAVAHPGLDVFNISSAVDQHADAGVTKAVKGQIMIEHFGPPDYFLETSCKVIRRVGMSVLLGEDIVALKVG